jgi:hypothetical protein
MLLVVGKAFLSRQNVLVLSTHESILPIGLFEIERMCLELSYFWRAAGNLNSLLPDLPAYGIFSLNAIGFTADPSTSLRAGTWSAQRIRGY